MILPENVRFIISELEKNGFSAYAVGGCVRDSLLGLSPDDWDITTSATPRQVKEIFPKTFDTGLKHGTVSVLLDGEIFEVTTFRKDGAYKDNRHPESITFSTSLEEDLARRDFTVNAMAYNEKDGLIDCFGGLLDLKKKVIRCVGDPDTRFLEDALRMLRAVRFAAQKGFELDINTYFSIKRNADLIINLSAERVISEFSKIILSDPEKIKTLYAVGLLSYIAPEMCLCFQTDQNIKWHIYDVGTHSVEVIKHLPKKSYLRFAGLMHDWGKPYTKGINDEGEDTFRNHAQKSVLLADKFLEKYKFSNAEKDKILRLILHHDREILPEKKYVKRAINAVGDDIFQDLINLKRADCLSQNFKLTAPRMEYLEKLENIYLEIKENKEPFSVKNLKINGNDLIQLGFKGKEIGEILNDLLEKVIEQPKLNDKNHLISFVKENYECL